MRITRRDFLGILGTAQAVAWASPAGRARAAVAVRPGSPPAVNPQRLRRHLEELSVFGRPPGGTFADGVTRVAYSDADLEGRRYVMERMKEAGLSPRIDRAGNIIARRPGTDAALLPVLLGSHIDSVPNGGNFDGALGSLAALEAIEALSEAGVTTRHPLELVIWTNEEGFAFGDGLCGSRASAGALVPGELDQVWNGSTKADAVRRIGGDPARIAEARRMPGSFHCYLELHIEQGGVLDKAGIPIGVVEGIVAVDRNQVEITGMANHAGTTPMAERRDALVAASHLVIAVRTVVMSEPGRQVGTVGQLTVSPNVTNVVPGSVRMSIELRDLSSEKIDRLKQAIASRAQEIAAETGTEIRITPTNRHQAALTNPLIQDTIARVADEAGLKSLRLPSGAGHDAQSMATLGPIGMIFAPSIAGISHSPKEATTWEDCARAASVLLQTVLAMDRTTVPS